MRRLDAPAVDLELRLTTTEAGADATALLGQVGVGAAAQAGQAIAQQRQLDLGLALQRVRVLGEDVEDHRGAVDGGAPEQLLQVELLGRAQLVVEHDGVGVDLEAQLAQLLGLALADEPRVVGVVALLHQAGHDVGAGRVDQRGQLVEAGLRRLLVGAGERDADDDDALADRALDERRAERLVVWVAHGRSTVGTAPGVGTSERPEPEAVMLVRSLDDWRAHAAGTSIEPT